MPDFFLVAKRHRTVVSYVAASTAEIVSIAVDPKHQGHGIGKALITHMLARLKASAIGVSLFRKIGQQCGCIRRWVFTACAGLIGIMRTAVTPSRCR